MKVRYASLLFVACALAASAETVTREVAIYGSTPAAISAAVQLKRMGKSAVVVSPETRIGGLTTGGLGATDIGNKAAFGGIALEFYQGIARHYRLPEDSKWIFEPSAALSVLEGWVKRDGLEIVRGEKLDRSPGGVEKRNGAIVGFKTLSGKVYRAKIFIDATYEGDLMAAAGVRYTVGREANSVYGETISGVQTKLAIYHKLAPRIDPYVVPGDPSSGLLPNVEPYNPNEKDGDGDRRVQAYCYRMCLTANPANRIPFKKPASYRELDYELLFRHFANLPKSYIDNLRNLPWINSRMPRGKTDTNNRDGFSTDFIGRNWSWPEASYEERERLAREHLEYQQGLMWTLANHPRVPEVVRREVSRWGTCKDEFLDGYGDGWQRQLYVREARRMVGECVMTEHHCRGRQVAKCPIAMAAYTMDSHHVRRHVGKDGFVHNEGDVEVGFGGKPYGIEYGAIVPKRGECANLFVPVCLSASHMAFGSIRMEPVFFALGQAAGTAAAQSIDANCAVQDLPYPMLAERLRRDRQVLSRK